MDDKFAWGIRKSADTAFNYGTSQGFFALEENSIVLNTFYVVGGEWGPKNGHCAI